MPATDLERLLAASMGAGIAQADWHRSPLVVRLPLDTGFVRVGVGLEARGVGLPRKLRRSRPVHEEGTNGSADGLHAIADRVAGSPARLPHDADRIRDRNRRREADHADEGDEQSSVHTHEAMVRKRNVSGNSDA
jgi:hypothetical protein